MAHCSETSSGLKDLTYIKKQKQTKTEKLPSFSIMYSIGPEASQIKVFKLWKMENIVPFGSPEKFLHKNGQSKTSQGSQLRTYKLNQNGKFYFSLYNFFQMTQ